MLVLEGLCGGLNILKACVGLLLLSRSLLLDELGMILCVEIMISPSLSCKLLSLLILVHHVLLSRIGLRCELMVKRLLLVLAHRVVREGARKISHVHCRPSILTNVGLLLRIGFELHILFVGVGASERLWRSF